MTKRGGSVLSAVIALVIAGAAHAQIIEPDYTRNPDRFSDYQNLQREAAWLLEAWKGPEQAVKKAIAELEQWQKDDPSGEPPRFLKYFGIEAYEFEDKAKGGTSALRAFFAVPLVKHAGWDPVFAAVLRISSEVSKDRMAAIQNTQLLVDVVMAIEEDYPKAFQAAREIFAERIKDERSGVRFAAVRGFVALPESYRGTEVAGLLIGMLADGDQLIVAVAAQALGEFGAVDAVRPLMERFIEIEEGNDPTVGGGTGQGSLNQARLEIAKAVNKIARIGLVLDSRMYQVELIDKYRKLLQWWEANKSSYQ